MNTLVNDITMLKLDLFMKIRESYSTEKEKARLIYVNKQAENIPFVLDYYDSVDERYGVTYRFFLNKLIEIHKIGIAMSSKSSRTILMYDHDAINEINFKTFLSQFPLKNERVIIAEKKYKKNILIQMNNKLNAKMKLLLYCLNRSKCKHSDSMKKAIEFVSLHLYNCIIDV